MSKIQFTQVICLCLQGLQQTSKHVALVCFDTMAEVGRTQGSSREMEQMSYSSYPFYQTKDSIDRTRHDSCLSAEDLSALSARVVVVLSAELQ